MRDEDGSNTKNFIKIGSEINPVRVTQKSLTHTHTDRHTEKIWQNLLSAITREPDVRFG